MLNKTQKQVLKITLAGVFSALSVVLALLIHFPIFPPVPFLEYDPADVTIYLMTIVLGPAYGIGMTVAVSVIQGLTVSSASGWVGIVMHIVATGSFVAAESVVLWFAKKMRANANENEKRVAPLVSSLGAAVSIVAGVAAVTGVMALWNLFLTPFFMGIPRSAVLELYPYIIAFNVIKPLINGVVAFALYKAAGRIIVKYEIM